MKTFKGRPVVPGKAEATASLNDLGDAVNENYSFLKLRDLGRLFPSVSSISIISGIRSCHYLTSSPRISGRPLWLRQQEQQFCRDRSNHRDQR